MDLAGKRQLNVVNTKKERAKGSKYRKRDTFILA